MMNAYFALLILPGLILGLSILVYFCAGKAGS